MTLNEHMTSRLVERGIPGFALAVVHQGEPLAVRAYGQARLNEDCPLVPEAVFDIASVSKTFLATLVMMWTPQSSPAANERELGFAMGLGWFVVDSSVGRVVAHNGETPAGFSSSLWRFLDADLSVIVLANLASQTDLHTLAYEAADYFIPTLTPSQPNHETGL